VEVEVKVEVEELEIGGGIDKGELRELELIGNKDEDKGELKLIVEREVSKLGV